MLLVKVISVRWCATPQDAYGVRSTALAHDESSGAISEGLGLNSSAGGGIGEIMEAPRILCLSVVIIVHCVENARRFCG